MHSQISPHSAPTPPPMISAALALWSQARTRHAAADLGRARIPVLLLKGPDLQDRLYGTPAAYPSGDVDILVPRRLRARARRALVRAGFRFDPSNGVLWRMSAAASYERKGFFLDLHWGLHAGHLPSWCFRSLERDLWANAMPGAHGMLEPDLESLIVFLAVHAAGHRFERGEWSENVRAAAALNPDWRRVGEIARRARAVGAVRRVMRPEKHPIGSSPFSMARTGASSLSSRGLGGVTSSRGRCVIAFAIRSSCGAPGSGSSVAVAANESSAAFDSPRRAASSARAGSPPTWPDPPWRRRSRARHRCWWRWGLERGRSRC